MAIKELALAAITSITQSDFVRAVTAAGASRRITVANLAKAIVENYTGSSLAGKSQSVKVALDSLNSNLAGQNWQTISDKIIFNLAVCKKSDIVFVRIYDNSSATLTAGTWNTIGTLPTGFRPNTNVYASGTSRAGRSYEIQLASDGTIAVNPDTASGFISQTVAFPLF